jgi:hypothetical protein
MPHVNCQAASERSGKRCQAWAGLATAEKNVTPRKRYRRTISQVGVDRSRKKTDSGLTEGV